MGIVPLCVGLGPSDAACGEDFTDRPDNHHLRVLGPHKAVPGSEMLSQSVRRRFPHLAQEAPVGSACALGPPIGPKDVQFNEELDYLGHDVKVPFTDSAGPRAAAANVFSRLLSGEGRRRFQDHRCAGSHRAEEETILPKSTERDLSQDTTDTGATRAMH